MFSIDLTRLADIEDGDTFSFFDDPGRQIPPALVVADRGRRGCQVAEEPDDTRREPFDHRLRDVPRFRDAPGRRDVVDRPGPEALVDKQPHDPEGRQGRPRHQR
jgi:hypothetical protein